MNNVLKICIFITITVILTDFLSKRFFRDMSISNQDFEKFLNDLWKADSNKCVPNQDYSLNLQGRLRGTRSGLDLAELKF